MLGPRNARRRPGLAALSVLPALLLVLACDRRTPAPAPPQDPAAPAPAAASPKRLEARPGVSAEGLLAPGEKVVYLLELQEDRFLRLIVDQRGADVEARWLDPRGELVVASDRPTVYRGPEEVAAVTGRSGAHRLVVEALGERRPPGRYRVHIEALRPATGSDRLTAEAARHLSRGNRLRSRGATREAIESYRRALALWGELGESFRRGETLYRLAQAYEADGAHPSAAETFAEAADLFAGSDNERWQVIALRGLGDFWNRRGETDRAIVLYRSALLLGGDTGEEAAVSYSLGTAHMRAGDFQQAIDAYVGALELADAALNPRLEAYVLQGLGVLYRQVGEWRQARDHLELAERAFVRLGDRRRQAAALNQLGQLQQDRGELGAALDTFRRVLGVRRQEGDEGGEAVTLGKIGRVLQALSEPQQAAARYRQALAILDRLNRPLDRARVLLYRGSLFERRSRLRPAMECYREAGAIFESAGVLEGTAEVLMGMARVERLRGELASARADAERALAALEEARPKPLRQDLRLSFFATVQHHYDFYVGLLMEMHRGAPAAGWDAAALEAAERAKARLLLDLLAEVGVDLRRGVDPRLLERERRIRSGLDAAERKRLRRWSADGAVTAEVADLDRQVRRLLAELEAVRGEIRRQSPAYAAMVRPEPLGTAEIQRQVLAPDTLLLEYKLGAERSYLWAATPTSLASFELPARQEIEEIVRALHRRLPLGRRRSARSRARIELCTLSRTLLEPVAGLLGDRRLLVVPDGALELLPFAALPRPEALERCDSAPPLVSEHEITYLPSASVLPVLRRARADRRRPEGVLAVVADPVYNAADERLSPISDPSLPVAETAADLPRAGAELTSLARLPGSRREAGALLELVPAGQDSHSLIGFEATKEAILDGRLAGYRILHFATHGFLDARPALSGLALSAVDEGGRRRDGFLRAFEIYNLDLPAELVVLSACDTALGTEVRGEGVMSLGRAFFYAGSARVMLSLWRVGDRSTAELMERFYRRMLAGGMRPAEALRRAQASMWREPAWSAPYHWAGFILQGDPR